MEEGKGGQRREERNGMRKYGGARTYLQFSPPNLTFEICWRLRMHNAAGRLMQNVHCSALNVLLF